MNQRSEGNKKKQRKNKIIKNKRKLLKNVYDKRKENIEKMKFLHLDELR